MLTDLRSEGCDSDASGAAQVVFPATAGRTYYVQITSLVTRGRLVFNLAVRGRTLLVSEAGAPGDNDSGAGKQYTSNAVISADGRYVVFPSVASNLVPGDTNREWDVFVRELATGRITRVSVSSSGEQSNDPGVARLLPSPAPPPEPVQRTYTTLSISADGRYVAFLSYADNLVPDDTNHRGASNPAAGGEDAFVHDRLTGRTTRVSVTSEGRQGTQRAAGDGSQYAFLGCCSGTAVSADGRYVAFTSWWDDLVPGDANGEPDVFVHDMRSGQTTRISAASNANADAGGWGAFMSPDGRYIGFTGVDKAGYSQLFVHDQRTRTTVLASFTHAGDARDDTPSLGSISDDGRYVAYQSSATNVVPGDGNGIPDAFRADLRTRTVVRVSVDSSGREQAAPQTSASAPGNFAPDLSPLPHISGDGRFVAFSSPASNLVPDDTNNAGDVFVHDVLTGRTVLVSASTTGRQGDGHSLQGVLSRDGNLVVFSSLATNLVPGDTNGFSDVFVRELLSE
jgi:Tol biopolymer transport system component